MRSHKGLCTLCGEVREVVDLFEDVSVCRSCFDRIAESVADYSSTSTEQIYTLNDESLPCSCRYCGSHRFTRTSLNEVVVCRSCGKVSSTVDEGGESHDR